MSFRHQFAMLSNILFRDLKLSKTTTNIHVVFMTAACTVEMFDQLPTLTGLNFRKDKDNVFWSNSFFMQKRDIFTCVMYTNRDTTNMDSILLISKVNYLFFIPIVD